MRDMATRRRLAYTDYAVRTAAFAYCFLTIGFHLWERGTGAGTWVLFAAQFLVYPHLVYWRAMRSITAQRIASADGSDFIIPCRAMNLITPREYAEVVVAPLDDLADSGRYADVSDRPRSHRSRLARLDQRRRGTAIRLGRTLGREFLCCDHGSARSTRHPRHDRRNAQ